MTVRRVPGDSDADLRSADPVRLELEGLSMTDLPARVSNEDSGNRSSSKREKLYAASQWTLMRTFGPRIRYDSSSKDFR